MNLNRRMPPSTGKAREHGIKYQRLVNNLLRTARRSAKFFVLNDFCGEVLSMKVVLKTAIFFIGIIFFTGGACPSNDTTQSNKVAQTEIYQSYSIVQNGQNYDVTAYLRIGGKTGTTLALSPPSNVSFNGQPMQEHLNTSSGTYYTATVSNKTAEGIFVFTDRNSKTYSNKIDLARVGLTPVKLAVNGTTPVSVPLSGAPADTANLNLEFNGQMVILSSGPGDGTEAYFDKVRNSIVVLPAAWAKAANGPVTIDLEVRNSISTQQGTQLGGDITFAYDSPQVSATLAKARVPVKKASTAATGGK